MVLDLQCVLNRSHLKMVRVVIIYTTIFNHNFSKAPDDSPQNISIIAADSVSVLIQWQPPHIPNGIITHYNIYVNFTNGTNITTNSVLGDSTLYLLDQLSVFQLVGVSISAITGGGEGPMSSFVFNTSAETGMIIRSTISTKCSC